MIDWTKIAKEADMTPSQFETEVLAVASAVAAMKIDAGAGDSMRFECKDDVGEIEMIVRRVGK